MKETTRTEHAREQAARRSLNKEGFFLKKSRIRTPTPDNHGGYMIVDMNNIIVAAAYPMYADECKYQKTYFYI